MLVDSSIIKVISGKGGDGAVSFHREKYVAKGGPDGGDGGDGGDVIFEAAQNLDTLAEYTRTKTFKASDGKNGFKNNMHGKNGDDLILRVPPGTVIFDNKTNEIIADLKNEGEKKIAARGGKGGLGNVHFKSATHQTPREFKPGEPAEEIEIRLELKLIADIGIIGLPNAGKSTLITALTNVKAKIADYPFTTLEPILGVLEHKGKKIVLCDIPGLIEGAAQGRGLGHNFLKHIERTKILIYLLDASSENLQDDYRTIKNELSQFDQGLTTKKELIVLNKIDLAPDIDQNFKYDMAISAASGEGLDKLKDALIKIL